METIAAHRQLASMAVFAHVVDCGGFSAAAAALGVSKSAISKQVSRLEASLGVSLLARSTRRLRLTSAGEVYYESCARVVAEAAAAEHNIGELRRKPAGFLRVNAPTELGASHVAPIIADFLKEHPDVSVDLVLQDDHVDIISEGVDVAVRIGSLKDSALIARRIGPIRTLFAASPSYIEKHGTPKSHADLRDHLFVTYSLLPNPRRVVLRKNGRRYSVTLNGSLRSNNGRAQRAAALADLGIVYLPDFYIADDLEEGRLVPLLEDYERAKLSMYVVYPPGGNRTLGQRLLIDFLVARLTAIRAAR